MGSLGGLRWIFVLIAVVNIEAQKKPPLNINSQCLGNIMRVDVGPLGGSLLEVSAVTNNSAILLTQSLAAQCGFSMKIDPLGNAKIYASIQNCFAQNVADKTFTTTLNIRLHGNHMAEEVYRVAKTCQYAAWASREIVCDRNYMEVSVKRAAPGDYAQPGHPVSGTNGKFDPRRAAEKQPIDAGFKITTLVFYTPEERMMTGTEAQSRGYGITNSPTRLVLRIPNISPETYTQNVAGVPMKVLKTSAVFEKKWLATRIDVEAACPILEGSVSFTPNAISWILPRHIDPLISSGQFKLLEAHLGVDGKRLNAAEMAARRYSMSVNNIHIMIEIPVGAVGGHFKSHVQKGQYLMTYTIEPMIELLWTEDSAYENTRYKVLLPVTTPFLSRPPSIIDNTVPEERIFKVLLGPFGTDVALADITFPSEVLSVTDCNVRGFNVLEHMSPNSSSKVYTLEVPFTDRVVLKLREMGLVIYTLHLTFGLLVLPEFAPFSLNANLEVKTIDIVPASVSGSCDNQNFHVLVKYGSHGFQTVVGRQLLTPVLAKQYGLMDNGTHFSFIVPFSAPSVVIEAVESSSIRSRLDVALMDPETNRNVKEFSVACNFFPALTECFPNGTMTTLALKLESVPSLNPSQLTLKDPACGPFSSDANSAYFVFSGNSCGTTRKFSNNMMMYENEISLPDELEMKRASNTDESVYELKVYCYYDINSNHAVGFFTVPRRNEPYAENAKGELQVEIRLATNSDYNTFYRLGDYPIAKFLQQPLYVEVELKSSNTDIALALTNCWATQEDDMNSFPRWDIIIGGCPNPKDPNVKFHPVVRDDRVRYPPHFKRFEFPIFAFVLESSLQLYVHCDGMVCDSASSCGVQCQDGFNMRGHKREASKGYSFKPVSLGPIHRN